METPIENTPYLWGEHLPVLARDGHKYDRGHAVILAAPDLTGATRLAASACSRIGAGLVTVLAQVRQDIYRATLPADIMVTEADLRAIRKPSVLLAGSGGISQHHREVLAQWLERGPSVLDAAAIETFSPTPRTIVPVLTPHEGEFATSFPNVQGARPQRAAEAARLSNAVMVLKGAETIIAAPDGQLALNKTASPYLAKAGTGDVLAGMITGLIAQGMPAFEAACAAVWMHGEAGKRIGPGLVASDIEAELPAILREVLPG